MLKKLLACLAVAGLAAPLLATAADAPADIAKKAPTAQQARMASCNAEAKDKTLKGDERKAFMKQCLSANKQAKQQDKMKACNADAKAKSLKGDERKAFMKECLSAHQPAA